MPTRTNPWKIGFLILAIAIVVWIAYAVTVPRLAGTWEKSNQFGGMFGGIGALFSGLALVGVVVAVLMQKEELELQWKELRKSVAAQTASSEALTKQLELARPGREIAHAVYAESVSQPQPSGCVLFQAHNVFFRWNSEKRF